MKRERIKANMVGSSDKQRAWNCRNYQKEHGLLPQKTGKREELVFTTKEVHKFTMIWGNKVDCTSWDKDKLKSWKVFEETLTVIKKKPGLFNTDSNV